MATRKDYYIPRYYKDEREVPFRVGWRKKRMCKLVRLAARAMIRAGQFEQPLISAAKEYFH